jgi:zinc protease
MPLRIDAEDARLASGGQRLDANEGSVEVQVSRDGHARHSQWFHWQVGTRKRPSSTADPTEARNPGEELLRRAVDLLDLLPRVDLESNRLEAMRSTSASRAETSGPPRLAIRWSPWLGKASLRGGDPLHARDGQLAGFARRWSARPSRDASEYDERMISSCRRLALLQVLAIALVAGGQSAPASTSTQAQATGRDTSAASVASYALAEPMPVDPEVVLGYLPNGLRYYVRVNAKPARQVELRLVVKAGSVLEDDDQLGLAHFVEHMEFEGTTHFPGQSLVQFLSSLGSSIGPDANATTAFDDTQYTLRVPTDMPGALDQALLALRDWAQGALFEQAGIDRQRGIVLAEWRMRLGAAERISDKIRRVQLEGSRYVDRPPIGKPEVIEQATREQLARFYRDWYRPDLMAVIVVGEVDRQAVVALIKKHFSGLTAPSPERRRPSFDVPEHAGTRYAVVTDKETTATVIEISNLRPARNQGTVGGYRDIMRDQLFAAMLTDRLDELANGANPPFLRAGAGRALFAAPRTRDEAVLQALVSTDGVARGLDALVTELERVRRFGFTPTELARAKQARMAAYERAVTESPDRESSSRADEYTRNFLQGEALPTIWQELAFNRRLVPGITLEEINALPADWFPDRNQLVVVSAPDAARTALPPEAELAKIVEAASAKRLEPYVDVVSGQSLMQAPPQRGSIVKATVRPEAGITEWTLSNGATVVLKPTTLKEDQVLFRAAALGGTSLASDADFVQARVADAVVAAGGVGAFSAVGLDRLLAGKAVAVTPFIDEIDEGMRGGSTPQDLETMFQLLYLRVTQPRADPTAFAALASQARGLLANQMASPEVVFNHAVEAILSGNSPRRQPETPATVDKWDLARSLAFYEARFADASRFTFVFVGSFTPESIRPLVETYVASLPATHTRETARDLGIIAPRGVVEKTIHKGIAPKSQVAIVFSGPFEYDDAHWLALRTMTLVLQSRLLDRIRQELGGTYAITVAPDAEKVPRPEYSVRIDWTCDPARTEELVGHVFDDIAWLRNTPLTADQVFRVRESLVRDFEKNSQSNGFLLNQISRRYEDGEAADLTPVVNFPAQLTTLTAETIQEAARRYLDTDNYVKVVLMPEGK